ncbi:ATP-binding cassette domain-containing protein, partial [Clostridioides difficile]|nr:ATP-binding cassette domain-containing protein [Clostridioides difficile]
MLIKLENIQKYYKVGKDELHVLKSLNLEIESGEFVMIMGKSGSGKTTLLNILG